MPDTGPTVASDTAGVRQPSHRGALAGIIPGLVVDVALPIATYYMLAGQGVPVFRALLISGVWPAGKSVMSLIRQRRVDEFSAFILTLIILGTLSSLLPFDHERVRQRIHRAEGNARLTRGQHRVG